VKANSCLLFKSPIEYRSR